MEVATLFGGTVLSSTLELLLSKLNSSVCEWLNLPKQIHNEMQKWKSFLLQIGALLEDAEQKKITSGLVKLWLANLRDLVDEMEEILEKVEIDAKSSKLIEKAQAGTSKSQKLKSKLVNKVSRFMHNQDRELASTVKDITDRLQKLKAETELLGLISLTVKAEDTSRKVVAESWPTSSLLEPHVYGRKSDKEAILQKLLDDEGKHEGHSVIPIFGMGGIGKTTLAQLVYNDEEVKGRFELKAWVCVSEEFDVCRITRAILEEVTKEDCGHLKELNPLQERLKNELSGKKFLLVLDDIWNENYERWNILERPFISGALGSKIIVTTRNENIGKMMMKRNDTVYHLQLLEDDACLSLFARHALGAENFDSFPDLKGVGEKIVVRCERLPLAIKALGGLLHGKTHCHEWENVLNSKIWDLPESSSRILPALKLSYNHLSSNLKRCFGYCSIFPKDYEFEKGELVLFWMAQGLLRQQTQDMKQMKDHGHQYFDDLLSKAFFQPSSRDESLFVMHDLMTDLALHVAEEIFQKSCHLSFFPRQFKVSKRFEILEKKKNLRTFMLLKRRDFHMRHDYMSGDYLRHHLSNTLLQDLMKDPNYLRVLSLPNCRITKLSNSIENLKHLRYIDLSNTLIKSLPDSVGYLMYLQTLLLGHCGKLSKLPATIGNLPDLQHLDIAQTPSLREIPSEINNLTTLVTLSKFIVGNARGPRLKDLKNLSRLQGQLSILDLHNVLDANDAREANLYKIKGLDDLSLEWSSDLHGNERCEMQVLSWLKPYQGLKRLTIHGFGGLKFPPWIGDPSSFNLEFLKLSNCRRSISLPSLERLSQLKELIITGMHAAETMTPEIDGDNSSSTRAFPSLESLILQDCPLLVGKFPKCFPFLKYLRIFRCPELKYSAVSLPLLEELVIHECSEAVLRSMVELNSIKTLRISKISKLIWLPNSFVESLIALEDMRIRECDELTYLWEERANMVNLAYLKRISVKTCPRLVSLAVKEQGFLPSNVQTLRIYDCEALESLPGEIMMLLQLEELWIGRCPALRMFPRGKLPTRLKVLRIYECEKLESLPEGILMNNGGDACQVSHLEELFISECPCLISFPNGHLPNSLRRFGIRDCKQLEFIPERMLQLQYWTKINHIRINGCDISMGNDGSKNRGTTLEIENCDDLEPYYLSIPNLRMLTIQKCENLKSLSDGLQYVTSLDILEITDCPGIQSIPDGGFPPNLTFLLINRCPGIESIPDCGFPPNLTNLWIFNCPRIESIPACGFPPNLTDLVIDCKNLKQPMQEWGLSNLSSLLKFTIYWICPPDDVFPTSLTSLRVCTVENMKSISRGLFQNLNSLQYLTIDNCPKLQSLPKEGLPLSLKGLVIHRCDNFQSLPNKVLPPSLRVLDIQLCPKLQSLPEEGLPSSLEQLWILNCPRLKRRYLEEKGDYWPFIAHIPDIRFDGSGGHNNYRRASGSHPSSET